MLNFEISQNFIQNFNLSLNMLLFLFLIILRKKESISIKIVFLKIADSKTALF